MAKKYWIERSHEEIYRIDIEANSEEEALRLAEEVDGSNWDSVWQSGYTYSIIHVENEEIHDWVRLFDQIVEGLPCIYDTGISDEYKMQYLVTNPDKTEIISGNKDAIDALADMFNKVYGINCCTGYYDPAEDERNGEVDAYTGMYYIEEV